MIFTSAPSATNRLKFIPVRGRKQHFHRPDFLRCWLKFIPVRGRKPLRDLHNNRYHRVEIYPREGTETNIYNLHHTY